MAVQAKWIRQNMFSNYDESSRFEMSPNRRLTEAEIKVQKSLEKLSIPEWYLNNSSNPPKILRSGISMEYRPASWKTGTYKKKSSTSASSLASKNSKGSNKSVSSPCNTYVKPNKQKTNSNRSPAGSTSQIAQNGTLERKLARSKKRGNTSGTFPRMSVSKKIQNINIVFPQPPKLDLDEDEGIKVSREASTMEDSFINNKSVMVTDLDDPDPECLRGFNSEEPFMRPNSPKRLEKLEIPPIPCRTPDFKSPALKNFKFRTTSTPQGSPVSIFSTSQLDSPLCNPIRRSPKPCQESIFIFPQIDASPLAKPLRRDTPPSKEEVISARVHPEKQPETPEPRRVSPRPPLSPNRSEKVEICDSCKENVRIRLIMVSPSSKSPRTSPTFRSPLLPITEDHKTATVSRHSSTASSNVAFIMSKKKSTAMENLIKKKRSGTGGKSLIQEIIDDLQEKCRSSPQPTYTSPGSRNFVRKLVKALEKNDAEDQKYVDFYNEVEAYNSESSSEPDIKSAASSTSLSFKDSDSCSDSEPRSPTLSSEPDYDWALNAQEEEKKIEDEESVFWVPVKKPSLPRTSSELSMLTSSISGRTSPCFSPIRVQNGFKGFQWGSPDAWGPTYRQKRSQLSKRLFRIDESGVLDSGYSDRSERSSATDACSNWSDFETTQSPSDVESSSSSFSRSKLSLYRKNIFIGTSIMV